MDIRWIILFEFPFVIMSNYQELPEGEWFCQKGCKVIDEILTQLVAIGPESLSHSIISELPENRQQKSGVIEKAESISPSFEWQILCGKGSSPANIQTLAEAVNIFTVCIAGLNLIFSVLVVSVLLHAFLEHFFVMGLNYLLLAIGSVST